MQKGKRKVTVMQRKEDYKFAKMTNLQLHENAFKLGFPQVSLKNHTETTFSKSQTRVFCQKRLMAQSSTTVTEGLGSATRKHLPSCFGQLFSSSLYYAP